MKAIKVDHYVLTADGTLGRVSYVHERDQTADLWLYDTAGNRLDALTLPLAELRRTTPPWEKKAPIVGRPRENQLCVCCGQKMPWWIENTYGKVHGHTAIVGREFRQWTGYPRYNPIFCTTRCALRFATASYRAGYRITNGGAK